MNRSDFLKYGLLPGAVAGLLGGLVFGAGLASLGLLPEVAALVRSDSPVVGLALHLVIAAVLGAGFGVLVWFQQPGAGETLFWGLAYGALGWFVGWLTLLPLALRGSLAWDVHAAQSGFPTLLGYLWYGAVTGLVLALLRSGSTDAARMPGVLRGALARGAIAGLFAGWFLANTLEAQGQISAFAARMTVQSHQVAWAVILLIGLLAGVGYAVLYPHPRDGAGPGLIRGMVYGFFWWVAGGLTVLPLAGGSGLGWSVEAAREGFATLAGYLLFGAAVALLYTWLDGLGELLFSDAPGSYDAEGSGTEGLRALGRGALAGIVGGLLFTLVMIRVGFLPIVASLIGAKSAWTGFAVHLVISFLIGASYGLLFRRRTVDLGSALGWGVSYGFFWWILGPLTLLPILLGAVLHWTVAVATGLLPSLVGHLAYGAGVGIVFYLMEAHYNPWWIPRTRAEATRALRRKEEVRTSAPALWALVAVVALTLPVILGM